MASPLGRRPSGAPAQWRAASEGQRDAALPGDVVLRLVEAVAVELVDVVARFRADARPARSASAAPDRPPNPPPTVTWSKTGRAAVCARSAAGTSAANSAAVARERERFSITSSKQERVVIDHRYTVHE